MTGKTINELNIGDSAFVEKTVSESDIYLYAGITMDINPAHINEAEASKSRFGKRVAHGMLSAGFISAALGTRLPGPGTIYLGQEIKFTAPVFIGDTIRATVTVQELTLEKNIVRLKTVCTNQDGKTVADGVATVMAPKV
ncbi:MAG: MaoC family dehydratase [Oscillospiraceae bacterium]|nr:MaoC family dehydratase [Oscillospiraceae bacterium]